MKFNHKKCTLTFKNSFKTIIDYLDSIANASKKNGKNHNNLKWGNKGNLAELIEIHEYIKTTVIKNSGWLRNTCLLTSEDNWWIDLWQESIKYWINDIVLENIESINSHDLYLIFHEKFLCHPYKNYYFIDIDYVFYYKFQDLQDKNNNFKVQPILPKGYKKFCNYLNKQLRTKHIHDDDLDDHYDKIVKIITEKTK